MQKITVCSSDLWCVPDFCTVTHTAAHQSAASMIHPIIFFSVSTIAYFVSSVYIQALRMLKLQDVMMSSTLTYVLS